MLESQKIEKISHFLQQTKLYISKMNSYDPEVKESNTEIDIEFDRCSSYPTVVHKDTHIVILDNVLNPIECEKIRDIINKESKVEGTLRTKLRANFTTLNNEITKRCVDFIPRYIYYEDAHDQKQQHEGTDHWVKPEINPCWRLVKCLPGSSLSSHLDGTLVKSVDHRSFYTLMLYLSNNEDGATKFVKGDMEVKPKEGRLLIFNQSLTHEGLVNGHDKYFIRSELLYTRSAKTETVKDKEAMKIYNVAKTVNQSNPERAKNLEDMAFAMCPRLEDMVYGM